MNGGRSRDAGAGGTRGDARPAGSRPPLWRDVRVLRIAFQVVVVGAVAGLVAYLADNLLSNLRRQGIGTGFGFLDRPAGFALADTDFRSTEPVQNALLVGVRNTAVVAFVGIALATVLGVIVGVARLSRNWLVRRAAGLYVETLRNVPVVVVIIFFYTAVVLRLPPVQQASEWGDLFVFSNSGAVVPSLKATGNSGAFALAALAALVVAVAVAVWRTRRFDATGTPHHRVLWAFGSFAVVIVAAYAALGGPVAVSTPERENLRVLGGLRLPPEFAALLVALVLYTASHIAEIVRGSILAVPRGQGEAATALGLRDSQRLRHVVLPQAFRIAVPPVANQYLNLTKNSSLAVFIAYPEITRVTRIAISQGNPAPQSIVVLMGIYLVFSLSISLVANVVNRSLRLEGR